MNFKFLTSIIIGNIFLWAGADKIIYDTQIIIATMFLIAALYFMENKK